MMFSIVSDVVIASQGELFYKEGRSVWNLVKLVNIVKLESLVIVAIIVIVVILSVCPDTGAELKAKTSVCGMLRTCRGTW